FRDLPLPPPDPRELSPPPPPSIPTRPRFPLGPALANELPDAVAGLAPVVDNEPGERLHKTIVHVSRNRLAVPRREIERVEHIPICIHLELPGSPVTDSYGLALPITLKV